METLKDIQEMRKILTAQYNKKYYLEHKNEKKYHCEICNKEVNYPERLKHFKSVAHTFNCMNEEEKQIYLEEKHRKKNEKMLTKLRIKINEK